ncbi:hypothetical protein MBLNU230_g3520t1 [Neophaeotheca triangularis]
MLFSISFSALAALLASVVDAAPAPISTIQKRDLGFNFDQDKVRGVNLGGWLLLEPWITPSIFEATPDNVVDEYTYCEVLGKEEARRRLENHWSSFITYDDFGDMKSKGINLARIPIGYWAMAPRGQDPYVQGAYKYLGQALDWANDHGIKVMIDLHGAPGSQNGFDNSGQRADVRWTQDNTVQETLRAITTIRDDHASHPAVVAIELVNEPMGPQVDFNTLQQFYYDGWGELQNSDVAVTFSDGFLGIEKWNDWGRGLSNLLLDTHHYEVFSSGQLEMSLDQHLGSVCGFGNQMTASPHWTISGEWSGAMTDCAKWLNGRGIGARFDGTFNFRGVDSYYIGSCDGVFSNSVRGLSADKKRDIAAYINAQMVGYEKAEGWIFWTWKNEAAPEWHFRDLVNEGLIKQPLGSYDWGVCG